jgi:glycine oxidase
MGQAARVIVAGAGALGLTSALALAEAGHSVTVCDPAPTRNASAVAAGMLAPVFEAALDAETAGDLDLLLAARNLWPALALRTGVEIERSGTVAAGDEAWLAQVRMRLADLGFRGADLPRMALDALAPGISPRLGGLLVREDWRLEPRPALAALRRAAEGAGVTFTEGIVEDPGPADWLLIATGADQRLAPVAPELGRLAPIKGQILGFADQGGGRVSLRGERAYATASGAGLAVGATMEPGRDDIDVDPVALAPLVRAASELFPQLEGAAYSVSAGVRAATPDGLPLVGVSQTPGVILAVGARRNGWLLAPLVARIVTACIEGRDSDPYGARLAPSRFEPGRAA